MIYDIWHLELLAFIIVITSVFPNGGSYFNGQDCMKAGTFILNLLHLIRVEWWMEGSAYSQAQTTPPDPQISFPPKQPQCVRVVSGTESPHFINISKPQNEWGLFERKSWINFSWALRFRTVLQDFGKFKVSGVKALKCDVSFCCSS